MIYSVQFQKATHITSLCTHTETVLQYIVEYQDGHWEPKIILGKQK